MACSLGQETGALVEQFPRQEGGLSLNPNPAVYYSAGSAALEVSDFTGDAFT